MQLLQLQLFVNLSILGLGFVTEEFLSEVLSYLCTKVGKGSHGMGTGAGGVGIVSSPVPMPSHTPMSIFQDFVGTFQSESQL